jgi:hypothetical protein
MRTLVLALGVALVLSVMLPCRAEFDSGGVAPAKPKTSGAAFDSGIAANQQSAVDLIRIMASVRAMAAGGRTFILVRPVGFIPSQIPTQPNIKNPSNIPRPKH